MNPIFDFFLDAYRGKPFFIICLEAVVFFFGIASVCFAKKEHILVYPTGLIATVITVYLFWRDGLLGDMMMNFYWSAMSIYGWWNWSRTKGQEKLVRISTITPKQRNYGLLLFFVTVAVNYMVYQIFGQVLETGNYIDVFTSAYFSPQCGLWH